MKMTTEQFSAVIGGLQRTENIGASGQNRRSFARISQLGWAEIDELHGDMIPSAKAKKTTVEKSTPTVTVHDISAMGIGFTFGERMESGKKFVLKLNRLQMPPLRAVYRVANCRNLSSDLFSVGAELVQMLEQ